MNKRLFIAKSAILSINIGLFIFCFFNYLYCTINTNLLNLSILTMFIIFIISLIDILKKKENFNLDKKYNIIFIISHIALMLIMLRGIFDPLILSNSHQILGGDTPESRMLFVGNNLLYFVIINTSLILYRLTIKKKKSYKK